MAVLYQYLHRRNRLREHSYVPQSQEEKRVTLGEDGRDRLLRFFGFHLGPDLSRHSYYLGWGPIPVRKLANIGANDHRDSRPCLILFIRRHVCEAYFVANETVLRSLDIDKLFRRCYPWHNSLDYYLFLAALFRGLQRLLFRHSWRDRSSTDRYGRSLRSSCWNCRRVYRTLLLGAVGWLGSNSFWMWLDVPPQCREYRCIRDYLRQKFSFNSFLL